MKKIDFKKQLKLKTNFLNRNRSIGKLKYLFDNYQFKTMQEVIENHSKSDKVFLAK